ncbi:hypothetical protein M2408_001999 [Sphingobacterium sp. BIGb0165]|nr:hypothetical protein [Sphingobacterium sp. BIGb0165]
MYFELSGFQKRHMLFAYDFSRINEVEKKMAYKWLLIKSLCLCVNRGNINLNNSYR